MASSPDHTAGPGRGRRFFRSRSLAARLGLLLLSSALSFGALELLLRTDVATRHLVGSDVAPFGYGAFMDGGWAFEGIGRYHPTYGYTLESNLRDAPHATSGAMGPHAMVSSNTRGMRGVREYTTDKPEGTIRVVAIGDSFTFGEEVADADTYPARLETLLDRGEVLNLGMFAFGLDQIYLRLRDEGVTYDPDYVVLGYVAADLFRTHQWFFLAPKPQLVLADGVLGVRDVPVPEPRRFRRGLRTFHYARFLNDRRESRGGRSGDDLNRAILSAIVTEGHNAGAEVVFVYLPTRTECLVRQGAPRPGNDFGDACSSLGIPCLDPTARLQAFLADAGDADAHFMPSGHYGPSLNQQIAEEIASFIDTDRSLPSDPHSL